MEVAYLFVVSLFVAAGNKVCLDDESNESDVHELNERIKVMQDGIADLATLFGVKLPSAFRSRSTLPLPPCASF